MRPLLLISDIDSVLCQTVPRALRWVWDHYGVVVPESAIVRYDMQYAVAEALAAAGRAISAEEIDAQLIDACWTNAQFYRSLAPRQELWAALYAWQRRGLPLQLMTRRNEALRRPTESWLQEHGLALNGGGALGDWPQVLLDAEKDELTAEACRHYRHVIFLEDALHHAEAIAEASNAEVYVVSQPWNASAAPRERLLRVSDAEIARRLASLAC